MSRSLSRTALVVAATGLLALFAAGCGSDDPKDETMSFELTDAGCVPNSARVPAGEITFEVENSGTSKVNGLEVLDGDTVLGEVENLSDGLSDSFSLGLEPGEYTLFCRGGEQEEGTLAVDGDPQAKNKPEVERAIARYRYFLARDTLQLVSWAPLFVHAVVEGNVAEAKAAYPSARIPYERVEPVAASFGDLDLRIDAREADLPASEFGGFHRIEKALWAENTTAGMKPIAEQLMADVEELQDRVKTVDLQAVEISNVANELLAEVSASKITGEEERYSHIDLVDFDADVEGAIFAFDPVKPLINDSKLVKEIEAHFDEVHAALESYRRGVGYVLYPKLDKSDIRKLAHEVAALADLLLQAPAQIVENE